MEKRQEPAPRLSPQEQKAQTTRDLDEHLKRLRAHVEYIRLRNAGKKENDGQDTSQHDPKLASANDSKEPDELVRGPDGEWVKKDYLN
ncbi:MAG: hypothetical protein RIQ41_429 [Candidatus Parcubacteria bacterium]|jgi:hypothetical protein